MIYSLAVLYSSLIGISSLITDDLFFKYYWVCQTTQTYNWNGESKPWSLEALTIALRPCAPASRQIWSM